MRLINNSNFYNNSIETLKEIFEVLENVKLLKGEELPNKNTALVIVDMINGFAREGALKSPRIEGVIPRITELSILCDKLGFKKLAFADCHTDSSPEFDSYPSHCIMGSFDGEVVDEIKNVGGYLLIKKNSTNGFLEEEFQKWLDHNSMIDNFIVTGDCTDICVQQFAITLKTWFNMKNKKSRVIVPIDTVETYDLGTHNGDLMNTIALYNMMINGIEIVKGVR